MKLFAKALAVLELLALSLEGPEIDGGMGWTRSDACNDYLLAVESQRHQQIASQSGLLWSPFQQLLGRMFFLPRGALFLLVRCVAPLAFLLPLGL